MKKNHFVLITFLTGVSAATADAQSFPSLKEMFLKMPESVCPALSEYNRLELVDNQRNNKEMRTRNAYKTFSTMETLTDTYAHLTVSKSAEQTFKVLATETSSELAAKDATPAVIMVISTVHSDSITDSSVSFYTTSWEQLPSERFFSQSLSDDFRLITMDGNSDKLTVTTFHPLTLTLDGSDRQTPALPAATETYIWNPVTATFKYSEGK